MTRNIFSKDFLVLKFIAGSKVLLFVDFFATINVTIILHS